MVCCQSAMPRQSRLLFGGGIAFRKARGNEIMDEPTFHIFMGPFDKDAEWVEAAAEFSIARQRMEEIAAAAPGRYFVFSQHSHAVLARMDTRSLW